MKFLVTLQRHTDKTLSYKKCQNPMLTQTSYFGILKLLKSRSCTSCNDSDFNISYWMGAKL